MEENVQEKSATKPEAGKQESLFRRLNNLVETVTTPKPENEQLWARGDGQRPRWLVFQEKDEKNGKSYFVNKLYFLGEDPISRKKLERKFHEAKEGKLDWDIVVREFGNDAGKREIDLRLSRSIKGLRKERVINLTSQTELDGKTEKELSDRVAKLSKYNFWTEKAKGLSRRKFLTQAASAITGMAVGGMLFPLVGCAPDVKAWDEVLDQSTDFTGSGENKVSVSKKEKVGKTESDDIKSPDIIDGYPVYRFNNPISSREELDRFRLEIRKSVEGKEFDLKNRGLELLVSKQAWERWTKPNNPNHPWDGQQLIYFIQLHLYEMNTILKNSDLADYQVHLSHIIICDESIEESDDPELVTKFMQGTNSRQALGSWYINSEYNPKDSSYHHGSYDDGLLHEWMHYLLFVDLHDEAFFNPSDKNFATIDRNPDGRLRIPERLRNFQLLEREAIEPKDSRMLCNAHAGEGNMQLSPVEVMAFLYSNTLAQDIDKDDTSLLYFEVVMRKIDDIEKGKSMASGYHFPKPEEMMGRKIKVNLYDSNLYYDETLGMTKEDTIRQAKSSFQYHWQVNENPLNFEVGADTPAIHIQKDKLHGSAKFVGEEESTDVSKLFIMEITDEQGIRKLYAFTTQHLIYWNTKENDRKARDQGRELELVKDDLPVIVDLD